MIAVDARFRMLARWTIIWKSLVLLCMHKILEIAACTLCREKAQSISPVKI